MFVTFNKTKNKVVVVTRTIRFKTVSVSNSRLKWVLPSLNLKLLMVERKNKLEIFLHCGMLSIEDDV